MRTRVEAREGRGCWGKRTTGKTGKVELMHECSSHCLRCIPAVLIITQFTRHQAKIFTATLFTLSV